jgi:hypothetical protein
MPVPGQPVMIQGTIDGNPNAPCASCGSASAEASAPASGGWRPLRSLWQNHPVSSYWRNHESCGCWAHFNGFSCSSLASEYAFVFGSCRTFYNQPCMKGPPPPAYPGEPPLKNKCPNCIVP